MSTALDVRRFRPADADAVWEVHEAALRASPLAFVEEAAVDDDILAIESHYIDAGGEFIVGEMARDPDELTDPEIVAIGGFRPIDEDRVEIKRMRVHPEYQRRGFARCILEQLETRALEKGYDVAELETIEPLRAARALYEETGYEIVEEWTKEATGVETFRYRTELCDG
ncbi:GNAT family N-acetyltransferase [Salinarchaeum chitinilyticum]